MYVVIFIFTVGMLLVIERLIKRTLEVKQHLFGLRDEFKKLTDDMIKSDFAMNEKAALQD